MNKLQVLGNNAIVYPGKYDSLSVDQLWLVMRNGVVEDSRCMQSGYWRG